MMTSVLTLVRSPLFRKEGSLAFARGIMFAGILLLLLFSWICFRADIAVKRQSARLYSQTAVIGAGLQEEGMESTSVYDGKTATPPTAVKPFRRFSNKVGVIAGRAPIAVVIMNVGLSAKMSETVINGLPENITIAFSPYADDLTILQSKAHENGQENWLVLPLEPEDFPVVDTGPLSILKGASILQNAERGEKLTALGRTGFAGFVTNADHGYDEMDTRNNKALSMISQGGFGLVDGRYSGNAFAEKFAERNNIPYARATDYIDRNFARADIQAALNNTARLAKMNGSSVLLVEATPLSLEMLEGWLASMASHRLQLVPLSYLSLHGS